MYPPKARGAPEHPNDVAAELYEPDARRSSIRHDVAREDEP
jgi:hypothetical protein